PAPYTPVMSPPTDGRASTAKTYGPYVSKLTKFGDASSVVAADATLATSAPDELGEPMSFEPRTRDPWPPFPLTADAPGIIMKRPVATTAPNTPPRIHPRFAVRCFATLRSFVLVP